MVYTVFHKASSFVGYCILSRNSIHPKRRDVFIFQSFKETLVKFQICSFIVQKLKAEYLYEDTKIIENNSVEFNIYEKAGYIYQDLMKTGECDILEGGSVPSTKVIILDYDSDEVIYAYTPEKSSKIIYSPGDQNIFYCVVFHNNYDIYVSSPIQVVGGEDQNIIHICLERKDSEYTALFQIRLYSQHIKPNELYSVVPEGYIVQYYCKNNYSGNESVLHQIYTSDSGILSVGKWSYFSLNTNYVMDISLIAPSDDVSIFTHQTFDGTITDSNLINIYFELDSQMLP